jgi:hypothetical protein
MDFFVFLGAISRFGGLFHGIKLLNSFFFGQPFVQELVLEFLAFLFEVLQVAAHLVHFSVSLPN